MCSHLFFYNNFVIFQAAVQHVTPQHTQHLPSEGRSSRSTIPSVSIANDFGDMTASTSNETLRSLIIEIVQNGRHITTLSINERSTIGKIYIFFLI